eukprot:g12323.t1
MAIVHAIVLFFPPLLTHSSTPGFRPGSDNLLALVPEGSVPAGIQEAAKRRVKGIQNDTPTWVYSILNFGGAVFDNLYMAVYTWRGPSGFWGWPRRPVSAGSDGKGVTIR